MNAQNYNISRILIITLFRKRIVDSKELFIEIRYIDSNIQGETCLTNFILGSNDGDGDVVCWGKLCLLGEVTDDKRQQIC